MVGQGILGKVAARLEKLEPVTVGLLANVAGNAAMLVATMAVTRLVDIKVYGEFRAAFSVATILLAATMMGRDSSIVFFAKREGGETRKTAISEEMSAGVVIAVAICVFSIALLALCANLPLPGALQPGTLLAAVLMIPGWAFFNLATAGLRAYDQLNAASILANLVQRVVRVPFLTVAAVLFPSVLGLTGAMLVSQLMLCALAGALLGQFVRVAWCFTPEAFFRRFGYATMMGGYSLLYAAADRMDMVILSFLGRAEDVAIYDVAVLLSYVVLFPMHALAKSAERRVAAGVGTEAFDYPAACLRAFTYAFSIAATMCVGARIALKLFGGEYEQGWPILCFLSLGYSLVVALGSPTEALAAHGDARTVVGMQFTGVLMNAVLGLVLVRCLGPAGVAISTVSSFVALRLVAQLVLFSRYKIRLPTRRQYFSKILPMAPALAFSLVAQGFDDFPSTRYMAVLVLLYAVGMALTLRNNHVRADA